jgi:ribosomal protein S27E
MSAFGDRLKAFFRKGEGKGKPYEHKCHKCGDKSQIFRKYADGSVICVDCASGRPKNATS